MASCRFPLRFVNYFSKYLIFASNQSAVHLKSVRHLTDDLPTSSAVRRVKLDEETLKLVCKLSLVDLADDTNVAILESAIEFADQLFEVELPGNIQPMYSVQENSCLRLREDMVTVPDCRDKLLGCARKSEEEYFVAPSGDLPVKSEK